jgi:hypothetical protein
MKTEVIGQGVITEEPAIAFRKAPTSFNLDEIHLDIETLGTASDSPVITIGAMAFNREFLIPLNDESWFQNYKTDVPTEWYLSAKSPFIFYTEVSLLDNLCLGRVVDKKTAKFWQDQDDKSLLVSSMACEISVKKALTKLADFIKSIEYKGIWAKSPRFDIDILLDLAAAVNVDLGINFRKERDVRTEIGDYPMYEPKAMAESLDVKIYFKDLLDDDYRQVTRHHPMGDIVAQTLAIHSAYKAKHSIKSI